jgi:hypothetical protein
LEPFLLNTIEI